MGNYKRNFLIHLDALGLHDATGRRKVGILLSNMGREAVQIYDSFEWAGEGADRYDIDAVLRNFDRHYGVHSIRNVKRQEFLNTKRGNMSIMDYIATLKRKAEHCHYGDQKEGFICDMIINGLNDSKCSEKLMDLPAGDLKLEKVIEICRNVELTTAHLKTLTETATVNKVTTRKSTHPNSSYN